MRKITLVAQDKDGEFKKWEIHTSFSGYDADDDDDFDDFDDDMGAKYIIKTGDLSRQEKNLYNGEIKTTAESQIELMRGENVEVLKIIKDPGSKRVTNTPAADNTKQSAFSTEGEVPLKLNPEYKDLLDKLKSKVSASPSLDETERKDMLTEIEGWKRALDLESIGIANEVQESIAIRNNGRIVSLIETESSREILAAANNVIKDFVESELNNFYVHGDNAAVTEQARRELKTQISDIDDRLERNYPLDPDNTDADLVQSLLERKLEEGLDSELIRFTRLLPQSMLDSIDDVSMLSERERIRRIVQELELVRDFDDDDMEKALRDGRYPEELTQVKIYRKRFRDLNNQKEALKEQLNNLGPDADPEISQVLDEIENFKEDIITFASESPDDFSDVLKLLEEEDRRKFEEELLNERKTILNKLDNRSTVTVKELTDYFDLKAAVDPASLPEGLADFVMTDGLEKVRFFQQNKVNWQFELRQLEYDKARLSVMIDALEKVDWDFEDEAARIATIDAEIANAKKIIADLASVQAEAAEEAGVRMVAALGENAG